MGTPEATTRALARAVAEALTSAHISQRVASARTGIPLTTLSRRLNGLSPFDIAELAAVADVAGTTVSELVMAAELAPDTAGAA